MMSERAKDLAKQLETLNNEVIAFVDSCSEEDWRKICTWEDWTVAVTARHIGSGHYRAIGLAKMIINGEKLPDITNEQIKEGGNRHARKHADCTKDEVLKVLQKNGADTADFIAGLSDDELDRTGHLAVVGGEITTQQYIEYVILKDCSKHLANMKAAIGI
jgi:hypothetical protein